MPFEPRAIEGILLAAGESRRMGFPKPLLKIRGRSFIAHLSDAMLGSVSRLVIVVGAQAERVRPQIAADPRIEVIENPNYAQGQISSLKAGLARIGRESEAALVHLVDHPLVSAATFEAVIAEYVRFRSAIVIARYRGIRGHPVLFDRSVFAELFNAPIADGARAVVNSEPSRVRYFETGDRGVVDDLDTPADLERAGLSLTAKAD